MSPEKSQLARVVARGEKDILEEWMRLQRASPGRRSDLIGDQGLAEQSRQILSAFRQGVEKGSTDVASAEWTEMRDLLAKLAKERARVGFSARETALFILSLKQALLPG